MKDQKVLLSIIIPVYNAQESIKNCLDSIISSDFKSIEIICIDDGSTDNTLSMLKYYENSHNNVFVYSQENQGPGIARKNGIKKAIGTYIGSVDSDDFVTFDYFSNVMKKASEYPDADVIFIDKTEPPRFNINLLSTVEQKAKIVNLAGFHRKIYKREYLIKNALFWNKPNFYEDMLTNISILINTSLIPVSAGNSNKYIVQKKSGSLSRSKKNLKCLDYLDVFKQSVNLVKNSKILNKYEKKVYINAIYDEWDIVNKEIVFPDFKKREKIYLLFFIGKYSNRLFLQLLNFIIARKLKLFSQFFI